MSDRRTDPPATATLSPTTVEGEAPIRTLDELRHEDLPLAGGKGASLGEMVLAGLPVPEGFVVLTDAYRTFVAHNRLQEDIGRLAGEASAEEMSLEEASRRIHEAFQNGSVPEELGRSIAAAYEAIGGGPMAVRSSATAEDLPGASFAGQHDSFLNVEGPEAVVAAVKRCWASLWNPRAITYRRRQGMDAPEVAIAVVVQRMVVAERAGVLFTANPLDHRRDRMLLSASWGLGEAVVGGEVTPDQWVLDAGSGEILNRRIADKRVMTVREASGTATRDMPEYLRMAPALDDELVVELAGLGRSAAVAFGSPQDIEWTWAEGRFYLVQSRPITALFPLPEPHPDPADGLRLYMSLSVHAQQMVEPLTPMGLEWWRSLVAGFATAATGDPHPDVSWYKVGAGRMFIDITPLLRRRKRWEQLGNALADKDPITAKAMLAFRDREGDAIIGRGRGLRIPLRLAPLALRLGARMLRSTLAPTRQRERLLRETDVAIRALEEEAAGVTGVANRVRFVEEVLARRGAIIWIVPVAVMNPGLSAEQALRTRLERWLGDPDALSPIQRALPHNPTTEMGLELWRLARRLEREGVEPTANHPGVQAFLAQYGHRAVWEIDPGIPRWLEDPSYLLEILQGYMRQPEEADQERKFRAHEAAAADAARKLIARVRQAKGARVARRAQRLVRRYRALGGLREQPKFDGARLIALARKVLQGAGEELVRSGRLDHADDVFFLTFEDLRSAADDSRVRPGADLRVQASERREEYRREMDRRAVPRLMTNSGECIFGVPAEQREGVLSGLPVSPGIHEGPARIVLHPAGVRLEPGEVIVCRGTDPAWTPLFLSAGALVMETGGAVSHGSIVAREYGLPAVAAVPDATERLREGRRIRVDGSTGEVTLLE
jgi:rifampicin phosphotransferase